MTAQENRPGTPSEPGKRGRLDGRAVSHPRWRKLGLAAALAVAAGTMLFATEARGRRLDPTGRPPRRASA